jgi:hypothetical protein
VVLDRRIDPLGVYTIGWAKVDICLQLDEGGDSDREGEDDDVERDDGVDIEAEVEGERDDGVDIVEGERATRCILDLGSISSNSSASSSAALPSSSPDTKPLPAIAQPIR